MHPFFLWCRTSSQPIPYDRDTGIRTLLRSRKRKYFIVLFKLDPAVQEAVPVLISGSVIDDLNDPGRRVLFSLLIVIGKGKSPLLSAASSDDCFDPVRNCVKHFLHHRRIRIRPAFSIRIFAQAEIKPLHLPASVKHPICDPLHGRRK